MIDLSDILAVTFDVGGTLIEPWPSVGHVYAEIAARHGHANLSPEQLTRRFTEAWKGRRSFGYTKTEWAAIVDDTFAGLVGVPLNPAFFPALYEHFGRAQAWRLFEDVRPVLMSLADRGTRLGVISNWDERLNPLLRDLDLAGHFEVITVSCEAGSQKPAKEIFELAARRFGLAPGRILHVGDTIREDVEGARGAGFKALHLARKRGGGLDGQVNTLLELVLQR